MYTIEFTSAFIRDLKKYCKKSRDADRVHSILEKLRIGTPLSQAFHDHQLAGKLKDYRELHVVPDWLLVYRKDGKKMCILCLWIVNHKKLKERERSA